MIGAKELNEQVDGMLHIFGGDPAKVGELFETWGIDADALNENADRVANMSAMMILMGQEESPIAALAITWLMGFITGYRLSLQYGTSVPTD